MSARAPAMTRRRAVTGLGATLGAGLAAGLAVPASGLGAVERGYLKRAEWDAFKARFMTAEGRIVDTGNGDRSHSEGQGFAMVLATAFDDPGAFLALWRWTRTTLQVRDDALLAWTWDPAAGAISDRNNATDGDLFVAWGLLRAFARWGEPAWRDEAARILAAVVAHCVVRRGDGRLLLPGAAGFVRDDRVVVNPSYWVYPAFAAFAEAGIDGPWRALAGTGRALVDGFAAGGTGLVPDWCAVGERVTPAADLPFAFGFDAVRVPLYLRWAYPAGEVRARLRPVVAYAERYGAIGAVPATIDLATGETAAYPMSLGAQAILLLAEHAVAGGELLLPLKRDDRDYYANVLLLLTKLAATEMPR